MTGRHAHVHLEPQGRGSIRIILAVLIPVVVATIVGMVALWPAASDRPGMLPLTDPNAVILRAQITAIDPVEQALITIRVTDVSDEVVATLTANGDPVPAVGDVGTLHMPYEEVAAGVHVGANVRVVYLPYAIGVDDGTGNEASPFIFMDYERSAPIAALAILYAVLVFLVARWRGLSAFVGLVLSVGVLGYFTIPALLAGGPPMPIALVSAVAIMFVSLYVAHGVSVRTSTALLGTIAGLTLTTGIAMWATNAAQLSGMTSEEAISLPLYVPNLDLRGLVMCGIVLAGLGVLNDVTVTQASAVWEMRELAPHASRLTIMRGALRVGRDHIASTVYTIVFAYLGASLPLFMLILMQQQSIGASLTSGVVAEEVVRTLVSSIGLVLAIPITTAIAAAMAPGATPEAAPADAPASPVTVAPDALTAAPAADPDTPVTVAPGPLLGVESPPVTGAQ